MYIKCPKCGSKKVQISNVRRNHGIFWYLTFGFLYIAVFYMKLVIGLFVFLMYDWWTYLIHTSQGKKHVWLSKKCLSRSKKMYYCHDCGYNFKD